MGRDLKGLAMYDSRGQKSKLLLHRLRLDLAPLFWMRLSLE